MPLAAGMLLVKATDDDDDGVVYLKIDQGIVGVRARLSRFESSHTSARTSCQNESYDIYKEHRCYNHDNEKVVEENTAFPFHYPNPFPPTTQLLPVSEYIPYLDI